MKHLFFLFVLFVYHFQSFAQVPVNPNFGMYVYSVGNTIDFVVNQKFANNPGNYDAMMGNSALVPKGSFGPEYHQPESFRYMNHATASASSGGTAGGFGGSGKGSATDVAFRTTTPVKIPGAASPVPVTLTQRIPKPAQAAALAMLAKYATPVGTFVGALSILTALYDMYEPKIKKTGENTFELIKKPTGQSICALPSSGVAGGGSSCANNGPAANIGDPVPWTGHLSGNRRALGMPCVLSKYDDELIGQTCGVRTWYEVGIYRLDTTPSPISFDTESLANQFDPTKSPSGVSEAVNNPNVKFRSDQLPSVDVSGPSSIPGPTRTSVTQTPDGKTKTTTTTTTINPTYGPGQITTRTTTTTTTTTTNPDGSPDSSNPPSTTTTEEDVNRDQQDRDNKSPTSSSSPSPDQVLNCEGPDRETSQCAKLGEPTNEEISKKEINIELKESPWNFGDNGSCLQSVSVALSSARGQQVTALDTTKSCEFIGGPFRAVVLLFASITALMIVLPKE